MAPTAPPRAKLFQFHAPFAPKAVPKCSAGSPPDPSSLTAHGPSRSLPSAAAPHPARRAVAFIFKLAPRRQIWSILCHVLPPRNWKRLVTPHRRLLRRLWPHASAHRGFRVPLGGGGTQPWDTSHLACSHPNKRFAAGFGLFLGVFLVAPTLRFQQKCFLHFVLGDFIALTKCFLNADFI